MKGVLAARAPGVVLDDVSPGYTDPGSSFAPINSDRLVEVAVRDGSAADTLGVGVGAPVFVAER